MSLERRPAHPDEFETAAYLDGTLDPPAREGMESHLAACQECRRGIALLRKVALRGGDEAPAEFLARARTPGTTARQSPRSSIMMWAAAAAGLILVASIGILVASRAVRAPEPAARYRSGTADPLAPVYPSAGEEIVARHLAFEWGRIEGADRYVVSVFSESGDLIAALEVGQEGPPLRWPASRPTPPPGQVLWKVRAMYLDRVLAESAAVPFVIR